MLSLLAGYMLIGSCPCEVCVPGGRIVSLTTQYGSFACDVCVPGRRVFLFLGYIIMN